MLARLSTRCSKDHDHQHLLGGRAANAAYYAPELITEILRGIRDTANHDEERGDSLEQDLEKHMVTANVMHDVR